MRGFKKILSLLKIKQQISTIIMSTNNGVANEAQIIGDSLSIDSFPECLNGVAKVSWNTYLLVLKLMATCTHYKKLVRWNL